MLRKRRTSVPKPFALVKSRDGTLVLRERSSRNLPATDSGMLSAYRPAIHGKPYQANLRSRIQGAVNRALNYVRPRSTTEQGASASASPSVYEFSLIQLRYERRAKIEDCRLAFLDDPRCRKSVIKFAREACRKGFKVIVSKPHDELDKNNTSSPDKSNKYEFGQTINEYVYGKAQEAAHIVEAVLNPKILSHAMMSMVEGEIFSQAVVYGDKLLDIKRMPAVSMERCTDDADEFVDPLHAFAQVDVMTNLNVATFPAALIHHGRWNYIDGERYGESDLVAVRRMRRLLDLTEEAVVIKRMTRAALRLVYNIGTPERPGQKKQIEDFKESIGFVDGSRNIYDPSETATDIFGNGLVKVEAIQGDQQIGETGDIEYFQTQYLGGLPAPGALIGFNFTDINRDILEVQTAEFLKETVTLSDFMADEVKFAMNLQLLLMGILPETVQFTVHFSESSIETPSDVINRVRALRQNIIGAGQSARPDPLISKKKAVSLVGDLADVVDVEDELAQIANEEAERQEKEEKEQIKQLQLQQRFEIQRFNAGITNNVGKNGKNGNGNGSSASSTGSSPSGTVSSGANHGFNESLGEERVRGTQVTNKYNDTKLENGNLNRRSVNTIRKHYS